MISKERAAGPVVLLDAGDALSRAVRLPIEPAPTQHERRQVGFIIETMGALGYDAMAVGERDLVLGVDELKKRAAAAKLTLLAANLVGADGKRPFEERKLLEVGGVKVGVFALAEGVELQRQGFQVLPPIEQGNAQAKALRKAGAELVIALLHLSYDRSLKVAQKLEGVDFAIQSHDGRVSSSQKVGSVLLVGGGERGRQLGKAVIELGEGPLFDRSDARQAREQLGFLEQTISRTKAQVKQMPEGTSRQQQERMLQTLTKRREELLARMEAQVPEGHGSVSAELVTLDRRVPADPEIAKAAKALEAGPAPRGH